MSLEPELFFGSQRDRIKLKTNKQTADESPCLKCQKANCIVLRAKSHRPNVPHRIRQTFR